jgi:type IV pilus assembly protein PilM
MLAGGSAALPGLIEAVTQQTSFTCSLANPFDGMQMGRTYARRRCAGKRRRI